MHLIPGKGSLLSRDMLQNSRTVCQAKQEQHEKE
jgi:hypothetical protein